MVLGLGEGEINISLSSAAVKTGKTVKGKLLLNLDKPRIARDLSIDVYCEREDDIYKLKENRRYILRQVIVGEQMYHDGDVFTFSFMVPKGLEQKKSPNARHPGSKHYLGERATNWFIQASLNVPGQFDITHRIGIKVLP